MRYHTLQTQRMVGSHQYSLRHIWHSLQPSVTSHPSLLCARYVFIYLLPVDWFLYTFLFWSTIQQFFAVFSLLNFIYFLFVSLTPSSFFLYVSTLVLGFSSFFKLCFFFHFSFPLPWFLYILLQILFLSHSFSVYKYFAPTFFLISSAYLCECIFLTLKICHLACDTCRAN